MGNSMGLESFLSSLMLKALLFGIHGKASNDSGSGRGSKGV